MLPGLRPSGVGSRTSMHTVIPETAKGGCMGAAPGKHPTLDLLAVG